MADTSLKQTTVLTNGIKLRVAQAGPADGPLVILLHGFPEYWAGWRQQIPALAAAGNRVWTPDQRGAWWLGIKHPHRLEKLAILNVPHPAVMRRRFRTHFSQLRKSWYIFFFQLPWLPERLLSQNGGERFIRGMQAASPAGAFTEEDVQGYLAAWAQPGAWTGMINWYRALFQKPPTPATSYRLTMPVRIIWGKRDAVLEWEMAETSLQLCDQADLFFIDEAAHFVQHDAPERVNELLLDFFK